MNPETVFSLCGALAMAGWLGLAALPRWTFTRDWLAPVIVPLLIGVVYATLMITYLNRAPEGGGFGSLAAVAELFSVPELLLAGWIHYLAFDLFVGAWIVKDAQDSNVPHLLILPSLLATFMAGPAGLLLYWICKLVWRQFTDRAQEVTS